MKKTYFFGWENIKWVFRELNKIYSNQPSFFSKKRIESGIAFTIAQIGMVVYLCNKMETLAMSDFLMWAGVEFAVSGYIIYQIQKEKKTEIPPEETTDETN